MALCLLLSTTLSHTMIRAVVQSDHLPAAYDRDSARDDYGGYSDMESEYSTRLKQVRIHTSIGV